MTDRIGYRDSSSVIRVISSNKSISPPISCPTVSLTTYNICFFTFCFSVFIYLYFSLRYFAKISSICLCAGTDPPLLSGYIVYLFRLTMICLLKNKMFVVLLGNS